MNPTPTVSPWLWASVYAQALAAGLQPQQVARQQRDARLAALLQVALDSPLYRQRLGRARDGGPGALRALEPVDKPELMQRFDEWATDRAVTRQAVQRFLEQSELADAFLGRYLVWTSSGTSGQPAIFVQDEHCLAAYEALDALRLRGPAASLPLPAWSASQRFAFVAATGGPFAGSVAIARLQRLHGRHSPWPWLAPSLQAFSVQTPLVELARQLQAHQPTVLITYPSCAAALAQRQLDGSLRLRLSEVWLGGEQLSDGQRALMRRAFACPLRNNYGASEFFSIACECEHGRLHLNEDWVLLEPVDRHLRPVAPGEPSHAVLLTHLANRVQPLLRYRLDDAVRFTGERCPCGCALAVIEVQGRSGHTLQMRGAHGDMVTLLPLALETAIEEGAGVTQFQLLCTAPDALELRFEPGVAEPAAAYRQARAALQAFLSLHGLATVRISHGRQPPLRERASGKLCRVRLAPAQSTPDRPPAATRRHNGARVHGPQGARR